MSDLNTAECDGMCLTGSDVGVPSAKIAYPHPGCPLHAPGERCQCGQPDRCTSYTHDPTWLATQSPHDPMVAQIGTGEES